MHLVMIVYLNLDLNVFSCLKKGAIMEANRCADGTPPLIATGTIKM